MSIIEENGVSRKNRFDAVAEPFLQQPGLPFAHVLSADAIEQAFARGDALFGQNDIYSTQIVLWAFLAQVLRGGKGAACAAAVADVATYLQQTGGCAPSGDTGDYCRARSKLDLAALRSLAGQAARQLENGADPSWLWHGLHTKLIDGFTFTMPDTPDNQREFPQQKSQKPGAGFPIARACAVLSLATAAICDMNFGPYEGKETGESALLRGILECLHDGDVAVFDRCFCSFLMLAILRGGRGSLLCSSAPASSPGLPPGPPPGRGRPPGDVGPAETAFLDVRGTVRTDPHDDDASRGAVPGDGSRAAD